MAIGLENEAHKADRASSEADGPIASFVRSISALLASLIGIAQTRIELLSTELQQEIHRVAEITVWTLIALLAAWMGLFLAALTVIFLFWDTHRLLATGAMTGAFALLALGAVLVLRRKLRSKPRLLEATLAELAKDREGLSSWRQ